MTHQHVLYPDTGTQEQFEQQGAAAEFNAGALDDPNTLLTAHLVDIIHSAVNCGLPAEDARVLCYALCLDANSILGE